VIFPFGLVIITVLDETIFKRGIVTVICCYNKAINIRRK
jgi:hypothetical protein